jgi:two-component system, sensor histidine kinase ChiS
LHQEITHLSYPALLQNKLRSVLKPGKIPLRAVLVGPFVLLIVGTVGLTGFLAWRNGEQTVNDLGQQLRGQVSTQVKMYLSHFLEKPELIDRFNAKAVQLGQVKLEDPAGLERYLWHQTQLFTSISFIQFATETGEFVGAERTDRDSINIAISGKATDNVYTVYASDRNGKRTQLIRSTPNYDPRKRPWYIPPVRTGKSTWSPIYVGFGTQNLTIAKGLPLYSETGQLLGVTAADVSLAQIDTFLRELKIGKSGKVFLLERSGDLIADSTPDRPYVIQNGEVKRINAKNSPDRLLSSTIAHLNSRVGNLSNLTEAQGSEFISDGDRLLWQVIPFQNGQGIDWLILVVVPASDFTHEIDKNTRATFLLCLLSLGIAIAIGNFTARRIARPLLRLCDASKAISDGDLKQTVEVNNIKELHVLAKSFNQMSDQLQKADRLKTDFLSNISHELKTPLVSILGFTKVIDKKFDDIVVPLREVEDKKIQKSIKQIKENLGIITSESQRLTAIIANVLDITNLEAGKVAWEMQPTDMGELVEQAVTSYQSRFELKDLSLLTAIDPHLPEVMGDRDRLLQVMSNLLSNALKFTETGSVTCAVKQNRDLIIISVSDTGIGISKEDRGQVFEKFKQVGDILTGKPQGTGLGLPICKEIITHHGGRIWFESKLEQGSTFSFTLPIVLIEG